MNKFEILEQKRNLLDKKRERLNWQLDSVTKNLNNVTDEIEVKVLECVLKVLEKDFDELWEIQDKLHHAFENIGGVIYWNMDNLMVEIEEDEEVNDYEVEIILESLVEKKYLLSWDFVSDKNPLFDGFVKQC